MARCNLCNEDGLEWKQIGVKWRLHGGLNLERHTDLHKCQQNNTPEMGDKVIDKDLESRKMKVIGFCFNKQNIDSGLLEAILNEEIKYVTD